MIAIRITELKTFLSKASAIKTDTFIPILSYVRIKGEIDKISMYKAGQHSFLVYEADAENEEPFDFLIEEKSLSIACDNTNSETALFEVLPDEIKITIGNYKQTSSGENVELFYKFPEYENKFEYTLSGEVLDAINAASKYAHSGKEFISSLCFVHLTNNAVCATDNRKSYYQKFDTELPRLVIGLNTCSVLSKFSEVEVKIIEKHLLFKAGSSVYGFSKESYESKNFELAAKTIGEIKRPGLSLKRDSILNFADKTYKLANGFMDIIEISNAEGSEIKLDFKSDSVKTSNISNIEVNKREGYDEPISFFVSAAALKQVISSMSNETLEMSRATHGTSSFLIFSEAPNHISFIMGIYA